MDAAVDGTGTREEMIGAALARYGLADSVIAEMRTKYMPLKVKGLSDKHGLEVVHDARMTVARTRIAVEKKRVELKSDALEFGRRVDGEAQRLTALMQPIEDHLAKEESIVNAEKARIKAEAEAKRKASLDARMAKANALGAALPVSAVASMSDDDFDAAMAEAEVAHAARKADEAAAKEVARVDAQRVEAQRQENLKAQAALDVERQRIADTQLAAQAVIDADRAAAQVERDALQALADDEASRVALAAKLEKAAADAIAKRESDETAEVLRLAEVARLMPQRDRVLRFAALVADLDVPETELWVGNRIDSILMVAAREIRELVQ